MTSHHQSSKNNRLALIEEMLVTNPEDPFLQYASALEHNKMGDRQKAIQILETLLSQQPEYLGTYYQLGKLYEESGKTEKALAIYREGQIVAKQQTDQKTLGELSEALMLLEEDED